MTTIIVLGGAGAVGSVAVKNLLKSGDFESIIIGDYNLAAAEALATDIGAPGVSARFVDALDPAGIREAIDGCDIVLNCVGPFTARSSRSWRLFWKNGSTTWMSATTWT